METFGRLAISAPEQGLCLRDAMHWYAKDRNAADRHIRLSILNMIPPGREGALNIRQKTEIKSLSRSLAEDIIAFLHTGALAAKAFRLGAAKLTDIPAEWWDGSVQVDFEFGTANNHGSAFSGIRVYPGPAGDPLKEGQGLDVVPRRRGRPMSTTLLILERMREEVSTGSISLQSLSGMKQEALAFRYGCAASTAQKALKELAAALANSGR